MIVLQWNTKYTRENWIYFKDGIESEIPSDILYEFTRMDRKHKELLGMNGKTVEIAYDEKYWYFIKYKDWEENVVLDPIKYVY